MRSLVPVQMTSRLVAGLAHIFLFRKLLKKLRPHRCEFCTEFFKPIPMDGHKDLLRRVKQRVACADAEAILRLSPILADVPKQQNRFNFAAREQNEADANAMQYPSGATSGAPYLPFQRT